MRVSDCCGLHAARTGARVGEVCADGFAQRAQPAVRRGSRRLGKPSLRLLLTAGCICPLRAQGEKRFVDRFAHLVQLYLKRVDEFVQSLLDDLADLRVVELRAEPSQPLFGQRAKAPRWPPVIDSSDSSALIRQK